MINMETYVDTATDINIGEKCLPNIKAIEEQVARLTTKNEDRKKLQSELSLRDSMAEAKMNDLTGIQCFDAKCVWTINKESEMSAIKSLTETDRAPFWAGVECTTSEPLQFLIELLQVLVHRTDDIDLVLMDDFWETRRSPSRSKHLAKFLTDYTANISAFFGSWEVGRVYLEQRSQLEKPGCIRLGVRLEEHTDIRFLQSCMNECSSLGSLHLCISEKILDFQDDCGKSLAPIQLKCEDLRLHFPDVLDNDVQRVTSVVEKFSWSSRHNKLVYLPRCRLSADGLRRLLSAIPKLCLRILQVTPLSAWDREMVEECAGQNKSNVEWSIGLSTVYYESVSNEEK